MKFLILILLALSFNVFGQNSKTILEDCLRIQNGACITKDELGSLSGASSNINTRLDDIDAELLLKADDADVVHTTGDESLAGEKTFTGKIISSSTTSGAQPCPSMTDTQMLAIVSPSNGDCVNNTTLNTWLVYDSAEAAWEEVGSGGGLSQWVTATEYEIGDIVIQSDKIYICLVDHTSGTFATDLAGGDWKRLNDEFSVKTSTGTPFLVKELQFPNNQVTPISSTTALAETGSLNWITDPGAEGSATTTPFTLDLTGTASSSASKSTTNPFQGLKKYSLVCAGGASGGTCDFILSYSASNMTGTKAAFHAWLNSVDVSGTSKMAFCFGSNGTVISSTCTTKSISTSTTSWQPVSMPSIPMGATSTQFVIRVTAGVSETLTINLDQIAFNPDVTEYVTAHVSNVSSTVTYTPTVTTTSGTMTNYVATGTWYQVGEYLYADTKITFNGAAGTWSVPCISLPAGKTVDTAKLQANYYLLGNSRFNDFGVQSYLGNEVYVSPSNTAICTNGAAVATHTGTVPVSIGLVTQAYPFAFASTDSIQLTFKVPIVGWTASNPNLLTAPDTFSTDVNPLTFCSSATCTLANLGNQPIGTLITFTYATSTNNRTGCTTAPTQSLASVASDGLQIFARSYNAASTCASPSVAAINIGKGMKGEMLAAFAALSKVNPSSYSFASGSTNASEYGTRNYYDEKTGIIYLDAGYNPNGSVTTRYAALDILNNAGIASTYFVINASKNPALTGLNLINKYSNRTPSVENVVTYSAKVAPSGAISSEVGDLFSGTACTNASPQVCTFNTGIFPAGTVPNCQVVIDTSGADANCKSTENSSSVNIRCNDGASVVTTTYAKKVFCHWVAP